LTRPGVAALLETLKLVSWKRYLRGGALNRPHPFSTNVGMAFAGHVRRGVITMRILTWAVPGLLFGAQICASAATILPGTPIVVRTDQPINVHIWDRGRMYPAHVAQNVFAPNGDLVIMAGSPAKLTIRETGPNRMGLAVKSITVNGALYTLDTTGPQLQTQPQTITSGTMIPAYSTFKFRLAEPLKIFD
jgi:hypothetical protein